MHVADLDDPDLRAALTLALVPGIGSRLQQALYERFGNAAGVLAACGDELCSVPGIGTPLARQIRATAADTKLLESELKLCREHGVRLVPRGSDGYPRPLAETSGSPALLYVRGTLEARDRLGVAVVGSRRATLYGRQQAERLAAALARAGFTIVSGLARGIDAAAHRGALTAGGRTIAVLGCGLAQVYPPEHKELADQIAQSGAVMSEMPMRVEPLGGIFPQRNRIISGLSLGVLIVEAARRSGALITARHAGEQGREVFAVPGRIDSLASQGCHDLIRDGAHLVRGVDDVLEALGPLAETVPGPDRRALRHPSELVLNDVERKVLDLVDTSPTAADAVISQSGLAPGQVLATLSVLEMRRLIDRLAGNQYVRR